MEIGYFWPHFAFSLGPQKGEVVEIIYPLKVPPFISRINYSISYVNISLMTRGNSSIISYAEKYIEIYFK